jgi:hypothetical protein
LSASCACACSTPKALHIEGNELVEERLRVLALTIAAGASQIQRNIIGDGCLGMPKEKR